VKELEEVKCLDEHSAGDAGGQGPSTAEQLKIIEEGFGLGTFFEERERQSNLMKMNENMEGSG
jgi:hypothetical protein